MDDLCTNFSSITAQQLICWKCEFAALHLKRMQLYRKKTSWSRI